MRPREKRLIGPIPLGTNHNNIMLIPNGIAPKIINTLRFPNRFDDVRSENQPKSGSLIASQIFPISKALPTKAGGNRAPSV